MTPVISSNPNAARPTLTLGRKPLAAVPTSEIGLHVTRTPQADVAGGLHVTRVKRKPKRHPAASALPWPPRAELLPAIEIVGEPVPAEQTQTYADSKAAGIAARYWARRVAHEVAATFPEDRREAVETFVLRHRLSYMNAFHRRLARADVVAALTALFVDHRLDPSLRSRVNPGPTSISGTTKIRIPPLENTASCYNPGVGPVGSKRD
jgi:hypothetical protein